MKSINLIRRRRVGCVPGRCVDFLVRCDPVDGTRSWWRTWRWVGTKRAFSIWKKSSPAGRSVASPESPIHPCKQKATFSIKKARGGRESDAAMARSGGQRRGRKSTGGWGWVEGGGGTMQPDASYSHLRGRTRGPLPLLYHYARAGKTSRLVGRGGWGEEKDGTEGGVGEDGSVDRSGWCIGTNAFAVKTGDARGNGVFLQQQPCEGRVNLSERKRYRRGLNRFAWTRAVHRRFMSFPETSVPNVNDFYFSFSVSPPFRLFSPRAPVRGRMDPWQTFPRRETFLRTRGTGRKVIDDSNRFIDLLLSPGKEKEIGGIYIFLHSIPSVIVGERRNVLE